MSARTGSVFAQLFTRDPLVRGDVRAEVVGRLTGLLPSQATTFGRLAQAWAEDLGVGGDLLWSAEGGAVQAAVHPVLYADDLHSVISVECPPRYVAAAEVARFLLDLGERLSADLGHLTVLDRQDGVLPTMYLTPTDLRRWLPEIWHGLLLGAPYVRLIDAGRIRETPAHAVERVGPAAYWVQLRPWDEVGDDPGDGDRRERVREHLGADLFWRPDRRVYRTPDFGPPGEHSPARRPPLPGPTRVPDRRMT